MARTKDAPPPSNDSALVERPQTWQEFQACDCGRLWLWEQTGEGRRRVSPVGLPHVCTTQEPERRTPSPAETDESAVARRMSATTRGNVSGSIAQQGEETQPQTTTPPLGMSQTGARSTQQITQQEYSTKGAPTL